MLAVDMLAPDEAALTNYDLGQMLTYARLLDAERAGTAWREAAANILLLDVGGDPDAAEQCWRSHLNRAHWVAGAGLAALVMWDPGG